MCVCHVHVRVSTNTQSFDEYSLTYVSMFCQVSVSKVIDGVKFPSVCFNEKKLDGKVNMHTHTHTHTPIRTHLYSVQRFFRYIYKHSVRCTDKPFSMCMYIK